MTTNNHPAKVIRLCCLLTILLAAPIHSLCEEPQLCHLGKSVFNEMSIQLSANRKIDATALGNSMVFVERCPASVVPVFNQFTSDKEALREVWLQDLKSGSGAGKHGDLGALLIAAHRSVVAYGGQSLRDLLDGVFDHLSNSAEGSPRDIDHSLEQQAVSTLVQFSHCDAAECYDVSDILLFLLGSNPKAFLSAMHSDSGDAAKWLSQLPDLSFAGDPSDARDREEIRLYLLKRISEETAFGFQDEKSQCIRTMSKISFRSWQ